MSYFEMILKILKNNAEGNDEVQYKEFGEWRALTGDCSIRTLYECEIRIIDKRVKRQ